MTTATGSTPPTPSRPDDGSRLGDGDPGAARWPLVVAAAAAVGLWFAALGTLAYRTANPVTVNRGQLFAADAVVVAAPLGSVVDGTASFELRSTLAGSGLPSRLLVTDLEGNRLRVGTDYVLSLRRSGRGYSLVPTPAGAPLVLPATPETLGVVKDVLQTGDVRPYP